VIEGTHDLDLLQEPVPVERVAVQDLFDGDHLAALVDGPDHCAEAALSNLLK
jgi:hypothetical protein